MKSGAFGVASSGYAKLVKIETLGITISAHSCSSVHLLLPIAIGKEEKKKKKKAKNVLQTSETLSCAETVLVVKVVLQE